MGLIVLLQPQVLLQPRPGNLDRNPPRRLARSAAERMHPATFPPRSRSSRRPSCLPPSPRSLADSRRTAAAAHPPLTGRRAEEALARREAAAIAAAAAARAAEREEKRKAFEAEQALSVVEQIGGLSARRALPADERSPAIIKVADITKARAHRRALTEQT